MWELFLRHSVHCQWSCLLVVIGAGTGECEVLWVGQEATDWTNAQSVGLTSELGWLCQWQLQDRLWTTDWITSHWWSVIRCCQPPVYWVNRNLNPNSNCWGYIAVAASQVGLSPRCYWALHSWPLLLICRSYLHSSPNPNSKPSPCPSSSSCFSTCRCWDHAYLYTCLLRNVYFIQYHMLNVTLQCSWLMIYDS